MQPPHYVDAVELRGSFSPLTRSVFPGALPGRMVVVGMAFAPGKASCFPDWSPKLKNSSWDVVTLPVSLLDDAPRWTRRIEIKHGLIICSRFPGELDDRLRDRLWQQWPVPSYEWVVRQGRLLATECENHAGWHQVGVPAQRHATCPCGSRQPLFLDPRELRQPAWNAMMPMNGILDSALALLRMWRNWQTRQT